MAAFNPEKWRGTGQLINITLLSICSASEFIVYDHIDFNLQDYVFPINTFSFIYFKQL